LSLVLGILIRDNSGNQEIIFASDGRSVAHNTKKIRNEDVEKIKKLTPKICMGYVGHSAELYEDVYKELENKIQEMKIKDLPSISSKLKAVILEQQNTRKHKEIERKYGPLNHAFIIGGVFHQKLRINILLSKNNFLIKKHKFPPRINISFQILGSTTEIHKKVEIIARERLDRKQSFDEIVRNIRYIISKAAESYYGTNDHIFIRRLSKNFEIETYIGYE